MWWALPLATTAMGLSRQNRQANDQRKYNLAQAEVTRYSPWTGQTGQLDTRDTGSPLEAGVGGAIQGLGLNQSLDINTPWFNKTQQAANSDALMSQSQSNPWAVNYQQDMFKPNLFNSSARRSIYG